MKVLYFGAEWCSQCRYWKPQFESLCEEKGYKLIELDADDNEAEFEEHKVMSIPTVITIDGNDVIKEKADKAYDRLK